MTLPGGPPHRTYRAPIAFPRVARSYREQEARGPSAATMDRRQFLRALGAGIGTIGLASSKRSTTPGRATSSVRQHRGTPEQAVVQKKLPSGVTIPQARWLVAENAKPGTGRWIVTGSQTLHSIEGYASRVSGVVGDEVILFVNTSAPAFHVEVYRMGYYQGLGGRLIDQTDTIAGQRQRAPSFTPGINMVECQWEPSLSLTVGEHWPPGVYLFKLVGSGGEQQYIPFTVRDDTSHAAYVIQNSVTTWQAYNRWGGYSLYLQLTASGGGDYANRSRVVSFDRPYSMGTVPWAQGAADFFGNEFPLLFHLESLGADLTYSTDIDLHTRPELLKNHRCFFSLGHDEYWSMQMREGAREALESGTNLAFLGANACYRQIRLDASPVGPNRRQVCYKDAAEDPLSEKEPMLTTVNWIQPPLNRPESTLIGSMYQSVGANDPLVVTDASAWLWDGCGLSDGQALPGVVQGEYDRYVPSLPSPRNVDVFAHSPIAGQGNWSDITYYTVQGGGGVLASGMASFIFKLSNTTAFPTIIVPAAIPGITPILLRAMENVYGLFGNGPASASQPSGGNWSSIYQGASASLRTAVGSPSA